MIRESMGQRRATRAEGAEDLVIPGVVVLDHWGIGKAEIVIGPGAEVLAGNGKILTAGGIHCHVRAGRPLLHTTVGLGPGETAWLPSVAPVAYASTVHIGADADVLTGEDAVRLPLPGGWVTTAWGAELHRVARAAERLDPGIGVAA